MKDQESRKCILIVEDSLGVAQALQRSLGLSRDGSYHVETCASGEAALKRLHEASFNLLISDLRLPGIDGLQLMRRARQANPGIRTLLITAYGSPEVEEQARSLANAYLPKPFRLQELIRLVERVLSEPVQADQDLLPAAREQVDVEIAWAEPTVDISGVFRRKTAHLVVLACDLDGTLAEDGQVAPETWEALRTARLGGLVLILVTGRTLDSFIAEFPYAEICEAIVAENGAVIFYPRREAVALPFGQLDERFLKRLETAEIPLERGMAIAATRVPHDQTVLRLLRESRSSAAIEYNREALMLLPPGATKGSGLAAALNELGYSPHNVVACGDGENDRSLFEIAELAAAVSNAQPALKTFADTVLPQRNGVGVQGLIETLLQGQVPERQPRRGRELLLGDRLSGMPVHLDPFALVENNMGIFGSSGSGKSWLAGLLAEELLKQRYQLCIIDPEGDYRGLGSSAHTLVLGGPSRQMPEPYDVVNILEDNFTSLVLDFSTYAIEQRVEYVSALMQALRVLRVRRGRPHCFVVDEIQHFCSRTEGPLAELFLEAMQWGGFCVVSFRISQISPRLLAALNHLLITRLKHPEELEALRPHLERFEDGKATLEQLPTLPKGQAFLCLDPGRMQTQPASGIIRFRAGLRAVPHIRHLHKYLRAPLPEWKRFYFHEQNGRFMGRTASSLWEFREALGEVSCQSLQYHMQRGDFEHWLKDVLHDEELARRVHKIGDYYLKGEELRRALLDVVIDRYEELEILT